MEEQPLISYQHVNVSLQGQEILSDVNLELRKGEFVYLIGKVGSGKSTLLKTIYGEVEIDDGEAWVLGNAMRSLKQKDLPTLRRKLGIVFQDFQLLTDRTVHENLKFVLKATGWKNRTEIERRIGEVLQQVGMENKGYKNAQRTFRWRAATYRYRPGHPEQAGNHTGRRADWQPGRGYRTPHRGIIAGHLPPGLSHSDDYAQLELAFGISRKSVQMRTSPAYGNDKFIKKTKE